MISLIYLKFIAWILALMKCNLSKVLNINIASTGVMFIFTDYFAFSLGLQYFVNTVMFLNLKKKNIEKDNFILNDALIIISEFNFMVLSLRIISTIYFDKEKC